MIWIGLFFIMISLFLFAYGYFVMPKNNNKPKKKVKKHDYCILIPARNESRVIENLIVSIENQSKKVNSEDVYIIVEDKEDPTIKIAKKHKMNIVFKKDLSKKRKGYALDDAIKDILNEGKKYTAYFIFDADNVLDKDFIKNMSKSIEQGYDIGVGYRDTKNGDTLVSCASALLFSLLNTFGNERKNKYSNNISISGTGFYIKGEVIEKLNGFPFNSLTEDYEFTLYCTLNNLTSVYNSDAIFYDEQPDDFKVSCVQRTRWVKGYLESSKTYYKQLLTSFEKNDINFASKVNALIGYIPVICGVSGIIVLLVGIAISYSFKVFVLSFFITLISLYVFLMLFTCFLIKLEKGKINIKVSKIKLVLFNPIFLASFVPCTLKAFFCKNIAWQAIPHNKN